MKITSVLTSAAFALGLVGTMHATTFTYNFQTSGSDVSTASPSSATPSGGPTVSVTAVSTTNGTSFSSALVTQNGSYGMGVRSSGDGSHTIDNSGSVDYLLFYFGGVSVDVNSFSIGYINGDSDYRWAVGSTSTVGTLYTAGTDVFNGVLGANAVNASNTFGTYFLVGAKPDFSGHRSTPAGNDQFKVSAVTFNVSGNATTVPEAGSSVALLGLALVGLVGLSRRFKL